MSLSSLQKTFREEVYNLFFQFTSVSGVGAAQTLTPALSKGVKSITTNGSGQYTIVLEDSIGPISAFLGKIVEMTFQGSLTNAINYRIVSATPSTRTIVLQCLVSSGATGGITAGQIGNGTITFAANAVP